MDLTLLSLSIKVFEFEFFVVVDLLEYGLVRSMQ